MAELLLQFNSDTSVQFDWEPPCVGQNPSPGAVVKHSAKFIANEGGMEYIIFVFTRN